ncbi:acyl-CoA hydrolase [Pullulanibacillus pueri]|uniref:Putative acyl-CoA thioester hydrolase YkhA n=1 Tax=Pullulanibacillus pueri TaxID=1437324 RepID=A0A8J2ZZW5_9BACL|nr:acyl-CoA thioesterase [Pullulanibacillus pueri]MBM7680487.1 acyl-CoA hydrolase [Pullulanibacillus pueri]GGH88214.1 putative acyl-CoA thioester hydrolase YkhA [Pullulanibacillus pueri]
MEGKYINESRAVKAAHVQPLDTNYHGTMFGGKLMSYIDDLAALSAIRHARKPVVTASTDSVDFLCPIKEGASVCLESFVTYTHKTSMEVFVKVITEDLLSGERKLCATSFLTFVALGEDGRPDIVPPVIPETDEEKMLFESAEGRREIRRIRREDSRRFSEVFTLNQPWEKQNGAVKE